MTAMNHNIIQDILAKAAEGKRLTSEEAIAIATPQGVDHIHALGRAGLANRTKRFGRRATYVLNLSVNPSNICNGRCKFCHYYAQEGDANAYVMTREEILTLAKTSSPREVHITGGMNAFWNFEASLDLISSLRAIDSTLYLKAFTAVEIHRFSTEKKTTTKDILSMFKNAGLNSLTGGGAEMFSKRLREIYCPDKIGPEHWLSIHREAHETGLSTNATMLYGIGERPEEVVEHLVALREAQDMSGGFSCFIPLAYQPKKGAVDEQGPTPLSNLRIIALARILLDNFAHIKAYWPMIGLDTASAGLSWGADDLDGTLGKERIAHSGDAKTPESLSRDLMERTVREGGFEPMERDGDFRPARQGAVK